MGDNILIDKKVIYTGNKSVNFRKGTKVRFHFCTCLCDDTRTIIDDSRKMRKGNPFELILGNQFKLEVWEVIIQKMALNEVAEFRVDKSLVTQYPFVSKTLRDLNLKSGSRTHCCAMTIQTTGIGYNDLNNLLKDPVDLIFTIELLSVDQPEDYEKETWQLNEDERLNLVPQLKEKGNYEYSRKDYIKASEYYSQAIGLLEQLQLKEKPHDIEWETLNRQKLPLLLNFSQCKLFDGDFYAVIEHSTTVLKSDPTNVKALFRRGKAHIGAWNPKEAREDLENAVKLDSSIRQIVQNELKKLDEIEKDKNASDREKFKALF